MTGPQLRVDIIDVYIFRATPPDIELLQLRRTRSPLSGSWQPIMGHIEPGETALTAARREVQEETGLDSAAPIVLGLWALEQVHPFYLPDLDAIILSPRFALQVEASWTPTLNTEHDASRWIPARDAGEHFMWPGQRAAIAELLSSLWPADNPARARCSVQSL
ncbi:MAG: NUDIX domain-containing protein [Phycisphaeraceae bacterium]|nr:NUDIX domain-containing protein [Phycisphaeraceae bacterium]MCW5763178.1 NUDIX domain-containing protein [Phycisphaeraceae bacterium]